MSILDTLTRRVHTEGATNCHSDNLNRVDALAYMEFLDATLAGWIIPPQNLARGEAEISLKGHNLRSG
jgi:hypothetical protein